MALGREIQVLSLLVQDVRRRAPPHGTACDDEKSNDREDPHEVERRDPLHAAVVRVVTVEGRRRRVGRRVGRDVDERPTALEGLDAANGALAHHGTVAEVFGPSFKYGRQWLSDDGREWALEFKADVAATGKEVHGIDLVSLNEAGRIAEFTVLARPPNAVEALKGEMMRRVPVRLAKLKAMQAMGMA